MSVRSSSRTGVPEIGLLGSIHPVTTLHNNATPGATIAFLSVVFKEPLHLQCRQNPAKTAAAMLYRVMTISDAFYDRADFDSNALFSPTGKSDDSTTPDGYRENKLIFALENTFRS